MAALLAVIIVSLMVLAFFSDLRLYDNLEALKKIHDKWLLLYGAKPLEVISLFILFNITMAMLPVPGISMISFIGGALFGFFPGVIYSMIATAVGNLGGFLLARYFFRDWIMKKYGDVVITFEKNWQTNGAMALWTLRLIPVVPSFLANFIMGVSPLNWRIFFWVSWIGRLPIVLVYAYAGVQIRTIYESSEILRPSFVLVFIGLGLFPWVLKFFLRFFDKAN